MLSRILALSLLWLAAACDSTLPLGTNDAGATGSGSGPESGSGSGSGSGPESGSGSGSGSGSALGSGTGSGSGSGSASGSGTESGSGSGSASGSGTGSGSVSGSASGSGTGSGSGSGGPTVLATFAFVVDGATLSPTACQAANWEFAPPPGQGGATCSAGPPCAGLSSVVLENTGPAPLAYTAQSIWGTESSEPPGVNFGNANELSGVLQPGDQVSILSVYVGGITAVLGSSLPFSGPSSGKFAQDEGTIPWPAGVAGSEGATTMQVAQVTVATGCEGITPFW